MAKEYGKIEFLHLKTFTCIIRIHLGIDKLWAHISTSTEAPPNTNVIAKFRVRTNIREIINFKVTRIAEIQSGFKTES